MSNNHMYQPRIIIIVASKQAKAISKPTVYIIKQHQHQHHFYHNKMKKQKKGRSRNARSNENKTKQNIPTTAYITKNSRVVFV